MSAITSGAVRPIARDIAAVPIMLEYFIVFPFVESVEYGFD
ncbi:MAG: hypothetical protein ACJAXR_002945 [Halopseudomonas sp.]|jgi:hypothetical protein